MSFVHVVYPSCLSPFNLTQFIMTWKKVSLCYWIDGPPVFMFSQVVTGGHYDVDCRLEDPEGTTLYKEMKKQYDSFTFTAAKNGTYKFCFSNEFSTFTHKTVYFDFQVGDDPPLFPNENRVTALTQVSCVCAWGCKSFCICMFVCEGVNVSLGLYHTFIYVRFALCKPKFVLFYLTKKLLSFPHLSHLCKFPAKLQPILTWKEV